MSKIGFIGLGNMGGKICQTLINSGFDMAVFDINPSAVEIFQGQAYLATDSLDVLRSSKIIFLSLPSSKQVEPLITSFIAEGVTSKIIIDMSTCYPFSTKILFKKLKQSGADLVDLPISGSPADALPGKLLALFGGDRMLYEKLDHIIRSFADRYVYIGETGAGHTMKLIMNFIGLSYVNIYALAFPLAQKMGIDLKQAYEIISTTGMSCGTYKFYVPKMIDKSYNMAFSLELALKDLTYCKRMFEEFEVPCYGLDGTLDLLRTAVKEGKDKMDYSACISLMYDFFSSK